MQLDSKQLSIAIQGPTMLNGQPVAMHAVQSARRFFPDSEIIVSCWDKCNVDEIFRHADKIITSPDPGPQFHSDGVLNVNRQIISSNAGAKLASREFLLKTRSDVVFTNSSILSEYEIHRQKFWSLFSRDPILITNLTTINPRLDQRCFALCDWFYLGETGAVQSLLNAPLFPDEHLEYPHLGNLVLRYNAEQWIASNFLAQFGLTYEIFSDGYVFGPEIEKLHHELTGKFFTLASWYRLGVRSLKHRISSFSLDKMYTQREWNVEFLGSDPALDLERLALNVAYHPKFRSFSKRLLNAFST